MYLISDNFFLTMIDVIIACWSYFCLVLFLFGTDEAENPFKCTLKIITLEMIPAIICHLITGLHGALLTVLIVAGVEIAILMIAMICAIFEYFNKYSNFHPVEWLINFINK